MCVPIASQIYGQTAYDYFFFEGQPTEADQMHTAKMAEELGITYIDLATPLKRAGEGLYFPRDVHWTPKGHKVVAKAIGEKMVHD